MSARQTRQSIRQSELARASRLFATALLLALPLACDGGGLTLHVDAHEGRNGGLNPHAERGAVWPDARTERVDSTPDGISPRVDGSEGEARAEAGHEAGEADAGVPDSGDGAVPPGPDAGDSGKGILAKRAADFVDSVGVNTHFNYRKTPYYTRFDEALELLVASGLKHVRSAVPLDPDTIERYKTVASRGIKLCMNFFNHGLEPSLEAYVARYAQIVKAHFLTHALYLEGHNEPDASWPDHANWAPGVRRWVERMWQVSRQDGELSKLLIAGTALAHPQQSARRTALGDLSGAVHVGNLHAYSGGRPQEEVIDDRLGLARANYPGRPIIVTEAGYHTALKNPPGKHVPASERAKAIYLPRLLLEHFRIGIPRTYIYQFMDNNPPDQAYQEAHFGLVSWDVQPKPSYHAVKNLLSLLGAGSEGALNPSRLDYRLTSGALEVRQLLLQKRAGVFVLAVWRPIAVWDTNTRSDLKPAPQKITLELGSSARKVARYRPTSGATPRQTIQNVTKLTLELDGELELLEIEP